MGRPHIILRITALITLIAFITTTIHVDFAQAARASVELASASPDGAGGLGVVPKDINVSNFTLPDNLGTIRDKWNASVIGYSSFVGANGRSPLHLFGQSQAGAPTSRVVIHIQDAHCNYDCQKKISEIIAYFNSEYGIDTINLEGGSKDYDLSVFTGFSHTRAREKVSDYFVKEGLVNGAEYFAANNPGKASLWGVEDERLYIGNLNVYRDSLKYKDEINGHLNTLGRILSELKAQIYSKSLLEFDLKYSQYKSGNLEFKEYVRYLTTVGANGRSGLHSVGQPQGVAPTDMRQSFPNLYLLIQSIDIEKEIDFKAANNERDELINMLDKRLSRKSMEELIVKTVEFKKGDISQNDFYGYLLSASKKANVYLEKFSNLSRYIIYLSIYEAIDKLKVMEELEGAEDNIRSSLARTEEEKELASLSKNLAILRNIFNISITKKDYEYYKKNEKDFEVGEFISFIDKNKQSTVGANGRSPLHSFGQPQGVTPANHEQRITKGILRNLDGYREKMSEFYEYSFKRDEAFIRNMKFNSSFVGANGRSSLHSFGQPQGVAPTDMPRATILITGGFHSENLAELFRKEGISYISILPKFTNCDGYKSSYFDLLAGKRTGLIKDLDAAMSSLQAPDLFNALGVKVDSQTAELVRLAALALECAELQDGGKHLAIETDRGYIAIEKIGASYRFARKDKGALDEQAFTVINKDSPIRQGDTEATMLMLAKIGEMSLPAGQGLTADEMEKRVRGRARRMLGEVNKSQLEDERLEKLISGTAMPISEEDIKTLHIVATDFARDETEIVAPEDRGVYRTYDIYLTDTRKLFNRQQNIFAPLGEIDGRMKEFIRWLNENEANPGDPEEFAARAFIKFINIHPFVNGNGRTGRLLINVLLSRMNRPLCDVGLINWNSAILSKDELKNDIQYLGALIKESQKGVSTLREPRYNDRGDVRLPETAYSEGRYGITVFVPNESQTTYFSSDTAVTYDLNKYLTMGATHLIERGEDPQEISDMLDGLSELVRDERYENELLAIIRNSRNKPDSIFADRLLGFLEPIGAGSPDAQARDTAGEVVLDIKAYIAADRKGRAAIVEAVTKELYPYAGYYHGKISRTVRKVFEVTAEINSMIPGAEGLPDKLTGYPWISKETPDDIKKNRETLLRNLDAVASELSWARIFMIGLFSLAEGYNVTRKERRDEIREINTYENKYVMANKGRIISRFTEILDSKKRFGVKNILKAIRGIFPITVRSLGMFGAIGLGLLATQHFTNAASAATRTIAGNFSADDIAQTALRAGPQHSVILSSLAIIAIVAAIAYIAYRNRSFVERHFRPIIIIVTALTGIVLLSSLVNRCAQSVTEKYAKPKVVAAKKISAASKAKSFRAKPVKTITNIKKKPVDQKNNNLILDMQGIKQLLTSQPYKVRVVGTYYQIDLPLGHWARFERTSGSFEYSMEEEGEVYQLKKDDPAYQYFLYVLLFEIQDTNPKPDPDLDKMIEEMLLHAETPQDNIAVIQQYAGEVYARIGNSIMKFNRCSGEIESYIYIGSGDISMAKPGSAEYKTVEKEFLKGCDIAGMSADELEELRKEFKKFEEAKRTPLNFGGDTLMEMDSGNTVVISQSDVEVKIDWAKGTISYTSGSSRTEGWVKECNINNINNDEWWKERVSSLFGGLLLSEKDAAKRGKLIDLRGRLEKESGVSYTEKATPLPGASIFSQKTWFALGVAPWLEEGLFRTTAYWVLSSGTTTGLITWAVLNTLFVLLHISAVKSFFKDIIHLKNPFANLRANLSQAPPYGSTFKSIIIPLVVTLVTSSLLLFDSTNINVDTYTNASILAHFLINLGIMGWNTLHPDKKVGYASIVDTSERSAIINKIIELYENRAESDELKDLLTSLGFDTSTFEEEMEKVIADEIMTEIREKKDDGMMLQKVEEGSEGAEVEAYTIKGLDFIVKFAHSEGGSEMLFKEYERFRNIIDKRFVASLVLQGNFTLKVFDKSSGEIREITRSVIVVQKKLEPVDKVLVMLKDMRDKESDQAKRDARLREIVYAIEEVKETIKGLWKIGVLDCDPQIQNYGMDEKGEVVGFDIGAINDIEDFDTEYAADPIESAASYVDEVNRSFRQSVTGFLGEEFGEYFVPFEISEFHEAYNAEKEKRHKINHVINERARNAVRKFLAAHIEEAGRKPDDIVGAMSERVGEEIVYTEELLTESLPYIAESIPHFSNRSVELGIAAGLLAESGKADKASRVADNIKIPLAKTTALTKTVKVLAESGRIIEAKKIINSMKREQDKVESLSWLMKHYIESENTEESFKVLNEAMIAASWGTTETVRSEKYAFIANVLIECGKIEEAKSVATQIERHYYRAKILIAAGGALAEEDKSDAARSIIMDGIREAAPVGDFHLRAEIMTMAADNLIKAGFITESEKPLDDAIINAGLSKSSVDKVEAIKLIAPIAMKFNFDKVNKLIVLARNIAEPNYKAEALAVIGGSIKEEAMKDRRDSIFKEAMELAKIIDDHEIRESVISTIAVYGAETGSEDSALLTVRRLNDPYSKSSAFVKIAGIMARDKRFDKAESIAKEAIGAAREIESINARAHMFSTIAELFVKLPIPENVKSEAGDRMRRIMSVAMEKTGISRKAAVILIWSVYARGVSIESIEKLINTDGGMQELVRNFIAGANSNELDGIPEIIMEIKRGDNRVLMDNAISALKEIENKLGAEALYKKVVLPLFFKRPDLFDGDALNKLKEIFMPQVKEFKYLLFLASRRETGPPLYDNSMFPHHNRAKEIIGKANARVAVMHNIIDGLGDELIRNITLMQSMLDSNDTLTIVVYTARPYLYNHPRVEARDIKSYKRDGGESYDVVIHHTSIGKNYDTGVDKEFIQSLYYNPPAILIRSSKHDDEFIYDAANIDDTPIWLPPFSGNAYMAGYELCAELGLKELRLGREKPKMSVIAGLPNSTAEKYWDENVSAKNRENRPVMLFNGFGGEIESKGYGTSEEEKEMFAKALKDAIEAGYFVTVMPNHQPWGTRKEAQKVIEILAAMGREDNKDYTAYTTIAPSMRPDPGDGFELSPEERSILPSYIAEYSDIIVTIEGAFEHFAYDLGKPMRVMLMPGSQSFDRWLAAGADSAQAAMGSDMREDLEAAKEEITTAKQNAIVGAMSEKTPGDEATFEGIKFTMSPGGLYLPQDSADVPDTVTGASQAAPRAPPDGTSIPVVYDKNEENDRLMLEVDGLIEDAVQIYSSKERSSFEAIQRSTRGNFIHIASNLLMEDMRRSDGAMDIVEDISEELLTKIFGPSVFWKKEEIDSYNELCQSLTRLLYFSRTAGKEESASRFTEDLAKAAAIERHVIDRGENYQKLPSGISRKPYLDIATGIYFHPFFKHLDPGVQYILVDNSYFAVKYLEKAAELSGHADKVTVLSQNVEDLKFEKASLGMIRSKNAWSYADIDDLWWENASGWIEPGGAIAIQNNAKIEYRRDMAHIVVKLFMMLAIGKGWYFEFKKGEESEYSIDKIFDTVTFTRPKEGDDTQARLAASLENVKAYSEFLIDEARIETDMHPVYVQNFQHILEQTKPDGIAGAMSEKTPAPDKVPHEWLSVVDELAARLGVTPRIEGLELPEAALPGSAAIAPHAARAPPFTTDEVMTLFAEAFGEEAHERDVALIHSIYVTRLAILVAERLAAEGKFDLTEDNMRNLVTVCLLHDIGKFAVAKIIARPDQLTADERAYVTREHTEASTKKIEELKNKIEAAGLDFALIRNSVASHHADDRSGTNLTGDILYASDQLLAPIDVRRNHKAGRNNIGEAGMLAMTLEHVEKKLPDAHGAYADSLTSIIGLINSRDPAFIKIFDDVALVGPAATEYHEGVPPAAPADGIAGEKARYRATVTVFEGKVCVTDLATGEEQYLGPGEKAAVEREVPKALTEIVSERRVIDTPEARIETIIGGFGKDNMRQNSVVTVVGMPDDPEFAGHATNVRTKVRQLLNKAGFGIREERRTTDGEPQIEYYKISSDPEETKANYEKAVTRALANNHGSRVIVFTMRNKDGDLSAALDAPTKDNPNLFIIPDEYTDLDMARNYYPDVDFRIVMARLIAQHAEYDLKNNAEMRDATLNDINNLLKQAAADYQDMPPGTTSEDLKKIFSLNALKIRPVKWETIENWERSMIATAQSA